MATKGALNAKEVISFLTRRISYQNREQSPELDDVTILTSVASRFKTKNPGE
jgi:hypothetical protein